MMRSSMLMSRYIHYAVNQKKENIWIAQREGRAKRLSDQTQEAVLKMYSPRVATCAGTEHCTSDHRYEYDPCDYLKAQEFQQVAR